jgi:hypothetical protein
MRQIVVTLTLEDFAELLRRAEQAQGVEAAPLPAAAEGAPEHPAAAAGASRDDKGYLTIAGLESKGPSD